MNNLSKENYVDKDDDFQRFCHISLDALKNMPHVIRCTLEIIKFPTSIKNYKKQ